MTSHYPGSVGPETLQCPQIHRVIGQDHVSGVHEDAGAHVDALLGGGGYLYLRHGHAVAGGNGFAQFWHALRCTVLQRLGAVFFQHGGGQAGNFGHRESVGGGVSSGEGADGTEVHLPENLPYRGA